MFTWPKLFVFLNWKDLKILVLKVFLDFFFQDKCSITFKEIETTKSKTSIYHAKITQLNKDLEEKQKEKNVFDHTLDCLK